MNDDLFGMLALNSGEKDGTMIEVGDIREWRTHDVVDPGEHLEQALSREVMEETGLTVTGVPGCVGTFDYSSDHGLMTRQFTFAVTVEKPDPIVLTEHDDSTWADPGELPTVSDETRALLVP